VFTLQSKEIPQRDTVVNRCLLQSNISAPRIALSGRLARAVACTFACLPGIGQADSLIDHRLTKDTGGIYSFQDAVPISLGVLAAGCALWQGTEDRLGKTCWQAGESGLASAVAAEGLQFLTGRQSPATTGDPNRWFSGGKGSFPSTHVSVTTGIVTPFIYQYIHDDPIIAALAVLPVYEMVARVKAQQHWQTDVLAGAALGFAIGGYEARRSNPLIFSVLPGGAFIGFRHSF
jgi:undecaprenyl-diphosphatase